MGRYRITAILGLAVALAGCTWVGDRPAGPHHRVIDEYAGTYKGVALGDSTQTVLDVFGRPGETTGPSTPLGSDFYDGGPLMQRNPPGYIRKPTLLRYDDVAFLSTPTRYGVHSIVIDDPQAATQAGVGIGDPLAKAKKAYPTLRCTEEQDGGEYSPDPAKCTGRVADGRFIWFGNDPIRMIALSPTPMT